MQIQRLPFILYLTFLKNIQQIATASWIALLGNAFLALLKLVVGIFSGSLAVISDGIDSTADVIASLITLFAVRMMSRPPDKKYPYGYNRFDSLAAKILSFVMFFAGIQMCIATAKLLFYENTIETHPSVWSVYVTLLSILGKSFLSYYQFKVGKATESLMLQAAAINMKNDIIISSSVLLGLGLVYWFDMPILDAVTGFLVSLWVIKSSFEVFTRSSNELLDSMPDEYLYHVVIAAAESVKGAFNPHRIRVRKIGNQYTVSLDVEVNPELTVQEAHIISRQVEEKIREHIPEVYDIVTHLEPRGNHEADERYGLSKDKLNTD